MCVITRLKIRSERFAYCLMDTVRTSLNFAEVGALVAFAGHAASEEARMKFQYGVVALKNGANYFQQREQEKKYLKGSSVSVYKTNLSGYHATYIFFFFARLRAGRVRAALGLPPCGGRGAAGEAGRKLGESFFGSKPWIGELQVLCETR